MIDHFASIRSHYSKSGVPGVHRVPSTKSINEIKDLLDLGERTPRENGAVLGVPNPRLDGIAGSGQGTPRTPDTKSRVAESGAENSRKTHGIFVQGTLEHSEHRKIHEYDAVENTRAARPRWFRSTKFRAIRLSRPKSEQKSKLSKPTLGPRVGRPSYFTTPIFGTARAG